MYVCMVVSGFAGYFEQTILDIILIYADIILTVLSISLRKTFFAWRFLLNGKLLF